MPAQPPGDPASEPDDDPLLSTRRSLVERLGNLDDRLGWQRFFDAYGGLLYRVARAAGLNDTEAQEAVQETVITVARNIGGLRYDPAVGSFKGWLLQTARWRIADQFRQRARHRAEMPLEDSEPGTSAVDRLPDPAVPDLERVWDREWQGSLLAAALAAVKKEVDPRQYQIFDCYVTRGWSAARTARELQVNIAGVYLAKHRVGVLLKRAVRQLERGGALSA